VGGGFTQALTPRGGIRADARAYLAPDNVKVLMSASGGTYPESRRSTYRFDGIPAIQISTAGRQSTLTWGIFPGDGLEVARGSGTRVLFSVTVGYYWRF